MGLLSFLLQRFQIPANSTLQGVAPRVGDGYTARPFSPRLKRRGESRKRHRARLDAGPLVSKVQDHSS